jgi:hypothetical protein
MYDPCIAGGLSTNRAAASVWGALSRLVGPFTPSRSSSATAARRAAATVRAVAAHGLARLRPPQASAVFLENVREQFALGRGEVFGERGRRDVEFVGDLAGVRAPRLFEVPHPVGGL